MFDKILEVVRSFWKEAPEPLNAYIGDTIAKATELPELPRADWSQPERADTSRYLHVSREADTIINAFGMTARIPAPKGTTYNKGKNASKRYVERLASNNKERRMLRSRLKKRMHELAEQVNALPIS